MQEFADNVGRIVQDMGLNEDQMLAAIGGTMIGAVISAERPSYELKIDGLAKTKVEVEHHGDVELVLDIEEAEEQEGNNNGDV